jgi:hypothetical protein
MPLSLESIQPAGPWRTPLTESMTDTAMAFGIEAADQGRNIEEFFKIDADDDLGALVTFSSAFERIAQYALVQTKQSTHIDRAVVTEFANEPILATHYALDIVSPHKTISVMRFVAITNEFGVQKHDGYERMMTLHRAKLGKNVYRQVVAFPYDHPFPYNFSHTADSFEALVPHWIPFLGKHMSVFYVQPWRFR